jgi:hypothetical protein
MGWRPKLSAAEVGAPELWVGLRPGGERGCQKTGRGAGARERGKGAGVPAHRPPRVSLMLAGQPPISSTAAATAPTSHLCLHGSRPPRPQVRNFVRSITHVSLEPVPAAAGGCQAYALHIRGTAFLWHQVGGRRGRGCLWAALMRRCRGCWWATAWARPSAAPAAHPPHSVCPCKLRGPLSHSPPNTRTPCNLVSATPHRRCAALLRCC